MKTRFLLMLVALLAGLTARAVPVTNAPAKGEVKMEKATFAAGCFWGVEAEFRDVKGVKDAVVGYTGGAIPNPSYEQVCTHATGHAEAVEITFDPGVVSYAQLLDVFWKIHDPTQVNRQGPDIGDNYRSAIFCHTPEQLKAAKASRDKLEHDKTFGDRKIATQIVAAAPFYRAEEYHQRYLEKHGRAKCHN